VERVIAVAILGNLSRVILVDWIAANQLKLIELEAQESITEAGRGISVKINSVAVAICVFVIE